ncbi:hypothetical protein [Neobacillus vireti]|uniref:Uncharacterized protein n=1 Tax=Neobacillus vireti LMG 21834 TaxID=1131730 RepID=A0AB94IPW1_9BACI|nr:hypothetical protein [Neobacillus vireti]ETI69003.1 hypothetical protein BAVI_09586 [Neobacillus vireti LMG 21834]KLT15706.1 hypothetical protein AA980_20965 [Neobacillus vireti]
MKPVLRPNESYINADKKLVTGEACPECRSINIKVYSVLSEGGWLKVKKCQNCLTSLERERAGLFGSMSTLTDTL